MKEVTRKFNATGYLRYGVTTMELTDEEYEEFEQLFYEEHNEWFRERGWDEIIDYRLEDKEYL